MLSKLRSVSGKEDNITIEGHGTSAKWEDHTPHRFVGLLYMKDNPSIKFTYHGSGHAYFGVSREGEEVKKTKVRCKKEHGEGVIELKDNQLKLIIDGDIHESTLPMHIADTVKPFFDIRFGDLTFNIPGTQFDKPLDGHVNGDALSLDTSYSSDGVCCLVKPLTIMEDVEVDIRSADDAHYWSVKFYLTNDKQNPWQQPYLLKKIKNHAGTVRLVKNGNGVCIQHKMNEIYAKKKKIHLSKDIYVVLCLFRSEVVTKVCKNDTSCISYVTREQQACVTQNSLEEMVLDSDTTRQCRPTDEHVTKLPRLESRPQSPMDEGYINHDNEQTSVKNIYPEEEPKTKLEEFHKILNAAKEMQEIPSCISDYESMFRSMKERLEDILNNIENNVLVPSCQIAQAKEQLTNTFQRLSL